MPAFTAASHTELSSGQDTTTVSGWGVFGIEESTCSYYSNCIACLIRKHNGHTNCIELSFCQVKTDGTRRRKFTLPEVVKIGQPKVQI